MNDSHVSVNKVFSDGWTYAIKYWKFWVPLDLIILAVNYPYTAADLARGSISSPEWHYYVIQIILFSLITPGIFKNSLNSLRGLVPSFKTIVDTTKLSVKLLFSFIFIVLITILGFIAFIIPGIYLSLRYSMTPYIILDNKDMSIFEAMNQSSALTKGRLLQILAPLFLIAIATTIFYLAISIVAGLFIPSETQLGFFVYSLISWVPGAIVLGFSYISSASVYEQLRLSTSTQATPLDTKPI